MLQIDEKYIQPYWLVKFVGTSLEEKPYEDSYATGSEFFEIDTGVTYYFDNEQNDWVAPSASDAAEE